MIAGLALAIALSGQDNPLQLRPPSPKKEELEQFHRPDVRPMPMSVRLDAYKKRTQMIAESPFKNIAWRSVGPESQGGRVIDIAVPTSNLSEIYVAFATGGLWRTRNEGQSWESLFDNESSFGIGDIDITNDGKTIWLGSGEANSQRTSYAGTGVFKSTDAGKTWTNMGLHDSHHIGRVHIDPKNPQTVYVAALGSLYSQGGERGLYKTADGGKSWTCVLKGDDRTGCMDIQMDPRNSKVLYASMWDRDRRAWNMIESGAGSGVFKSTDAGATWTKMNGLPSGFAMGRTALAIAPSRPDTIYAFMDNQGPDLATGSYDEYRGDGDLTLTRFRRMSLEGIKKIPNDKLSSFLLGVLPREDKADDVVKKIKDGSLNLIGLSELMLKRNPSVFDMDINDTEIWRSDNAGATWVKTRPDMGNHGGYYWNDITVSPYDHKEVYTTGVFLLKTTDAGASWTTIARRNHVDHHAFWIDPKNPKKMLNGNDGGIYVSYDGGENWNHWNNLAVGQFTTIAVDDKPTYNIYGGLQDNGTMKGPSNYRPGSSSPDSWTAIGGGDGSAIAVDPRGGGDIVYIASQFGVHSAVDQANNRRWSARANPAQGEESLRYNWISPIHISTFHPDIVYLGSQKLHRSFTQGRNYEYLSGDLTKNIPNGDVPHSSLTTISESPFKFGVIYVGADDGSVKMTPDSGQTWVDIATPQKDRWVTRIIASQYDKARVYCTQNGYRQDEWTPYVWVSEDFGKSWKSIVSNLPFEPVNTIREDPANKDVLYVGTDMGVYVSMNRGQSWMAYGSGIMHTPVHDLVIQPKAKEMVIASHARSVWVVSIDPILKLTDEIKKKEFHEWNIDVPAGRDRWAYDRTAAYSDPDYREREIAWDLWTTVTGKGKLELLAADGSVVRSTDITLDNGYNFAKLGLKLKDGDPKAPPFTAIDPNDPESALKDPYLSRRAVYVAKGEYTLRLTVGSKTFEKKVTIR